MTEQINEEAVRLKRLEDIKSAGVEAYPARSVERVPLLQARQSLEGTKVKVAGRLVSKREMGKLCFPILKILAINFRWLFPKKNWAKKLINFLLRIMIWEILSGLKARCLPPTKAKPRF